MNVKRAKAKLSIPIVTMDRRTAEYIRKIVKANLKYSFEVQIAAAKLLYTTKRRGFGKR